MCLLGGERLAACLIIGKTRTKYLRPYSLNPFIFFDSQLRSRAAPACLMNTKSCNHYSDFCGRFSSTSLWPIKLDSTAGIRKQTAADLSDVRALAGASHGCTLRRFISPSRSWRLLLQARDDKAADERCFSVLKPQSFSPSSVISGELVTRTSVTSNMRHSGCGLMRTRHDDTNAHTRADTLSFWFPLECKRRMKLHKSALTPISEHASG